MNLIGVDWGSSSLRAFRYGADGGVVERRGDGRGIRNVADGGFEPVLRDLLAGWLEPGSRVALCGMVTSRNGWAETPYADCPARPGDLAAAALRRELSGAELIFMPGLCRRGTEPDVMRGEETQLLGLDLPEGAPRLVVMPGTHSKWALAGRDRVDTFRTIMTGELYDLLLSHALVGRLAQGDGFDAAQFLAGVERGHRSATPVADLFGARAGVLLGEMPAGAVASRLSGLLIGNELREGLAAFGRPSAPVILVGSQMLAARYAQALDHLGLACETAPEDAAARGLWRVLNALAGPGSRL